MQAHLPEIAHSMVNPQSHSHSKGTEPISSMASKYPPHFSRTWTLQTNPLADCQIGSRLRSDTVTALNSANIHESRRKPCRCSIPLKPVQGNESVRIRS